MLVCKVMGSVTSPTKCPELTGYKLLLLKPINVETLEEEHDLFVGLDAVGAGVGDIVICVRGSSSRATPDLRKSPSDNSVLAILDTIDINGKRVYEKFVKES